MFQIQDMFEFYPKPFSTRLIPNYTNGGPNVDPPNKLMIHKIKIK